MPDRRRGPRVPLSVSIGELVVIVMIALHIYFEVVR
jgi:hypothetical protein